MSLWTATPVALAAEIKVMSTVALNAPLDDLKPKFESATGNELTIVYGLIAELKKRIQEGETADVMLLSRAGAPKPDISTSDALKRTLLGCGSGQRADPVHDRSDGCRRAQVLGHGTGLRCVDGQ